MIPGSKVNPDRLETISPSGAKKLLECEFKVACSLDPTLKKYNKKTERTVLGSAYHNFVERIYKTAGVEVDQIDSIWDEFIEKAEKELAESWHPRETQPKTTWSGYLRIRRKARQKAKNIIKNREISDSANRTYRSRQNTASEMAPDEMKIFDFALPDLGKPLSEQWMEVEQENIKGKVDLIECYEKDKYVIVDLKTGKVDEAASQTHKIQLFLYAYMFYRIKGFWPEKLEIEGIDQRRVPIVFTPEEILNQVEEILLSRESFNTKRDSAQPKFVASPSSATCQWCSYRVVCGSYWESYETSWHNGKGKAICGLITSADDGRDELEIVSPINRQGEKIPLPTPHPDEEERRKDDHRWLMVTDYLAEQNGALKPGPETNYVYY